MRHARQIGPAVVAILLLASVADASVLCARRRPDGTFNTSVKVREACKPSEVVLQPSDVGFCCGATTSTTSVTSCPTSTTLGIPDCAGTFCFGLCRSGQLCSDIGNGQCGCTGPVLCGGSLNTCGGECPFAQTCEQISVPEGCPSVGCTCR